MERTKYGVCFGVFFFGVHAYEGAKVVVGDLALVPRKTRFDVQSIQETEMGSDSRFNKLVPPLLSVSALHPVLVELA